MKTVKQFFVAASLALCAAVNAWGGGSSYYAMATVAKATASTGDGTVYLSKSSGATSGETTLTSDSTSSSGGTVSLYAYAVAAEGSEFIGWSKTDGESDLGVGGKNGQITLSLKASTSDGKTNNNGTWYALFMEKTLAAFNVTFSTSGTGMYTVNGSSPTDISGATKVQKLTLASNDPNFLDWKINGNAVVSNPYELSCTENTTVVAEFLSADQVTEATTYDAVIAALADDQYKVVTIPTGTDVWITSGKTITIPAGKKLTVDGRLVVVGTLAVNGGVAGSGKVLQVTKTISQGAVITPTNAYTNYPSVKYRVTTVANASGTINGTIGCTQKYGVLLNNTSVYEMSIASPTKFTVSFDTAVAKNSISSVTGASTGEITSDANYVLAADTTISGPQNNSKLSFSKVVDCAGFTCSTSSTEAGSNFGSTSEFSGFLNGKVSISKSVNMKAHYVNCSSVTMKTTNCSSGKTAGALRFYDCGPSISISYASGGDQEATDTFFFYSGTYNSFTWKDRYAVLGGTYSSNPANYLTDSSLTVDTTVVSGKYTVVKDTPKPDVASIGSTLYKTLAAAVNAATSGATVKLLQDVELTEALVVPANANLLIELDGNDITGAAIENHGTLKIEDNSSYATLGTVASAVVNNGTLQICRGTYTGACTQSAGSLTTHAGCFRGVLTVNGGAVHLRGGKFVQNVGSLLEDGFQATPYNHFVSGAYEGTYYWVGPLRKARSESTTISNTDVARRFYAIEQASDVALMKKYLGSNKTSRSDYTDVEWYRLQELIYAWTPVYSRAVEITLQFDRAVAAGSVTGRGRVSGMMRDADAPAMSAGEHLPCVNPSVVDEGYAAISYSRFLQGEFDYADAGLRNNSIDNIGTTVTIGLYLSTRYKASQDDHGNYTYGYTYEEPNCVASYSYKFTGNGAIAGTTDYTSLAAAPTAANYSGTVKLSKDCAEQLTINQACSFTLDNNNFEMNGAIEPAVGFKLETESVAGGTQYTVIKTMTPVAVIGNTGYATLVEALSAAEAGDTVTLMADITNFTGTVSINKSITLDGAGHSITAAPVSEHRNVGSAYVNGTSMFKLQTGTITIRNITLDGDATHAYTYLVTADNNSVSLTTENVTLLNGGELAGDDQGAVLEAGAGYGAAIHLNNGATLVVKDGFTACSGGTENGVFPFTGILIDENGANVTFDLENDTAADPTVNIGGDLLLVGIPMALDPEVAQGFLDEMKVPSRFIPYTLTLGDGSAYAFTGASLLGWNDIIDYGKEIMDASTAIGYTGLDKNETPVEVGLLADTVLPDEFTFEDANLTVNGNGNALSGTIVYTENAGSIEDVVMGTEANPLVLDMTGIDDPATFGEGVTFENVIIELSSENAEAGTPVLTWPTDSGATLSMDGVTIRFIDPATGEPTNDTADLIFDNENGIAFIGPAEARLSGPTHDQPIYTTLAGAIAAAVAGDTVTLMADVDIESNIGITIPADCNITLDLNGKTISQVAPDAAESYAIKNYGTLTIEDSSEVLNGNGQVVTEGTGVIVAKCEQPSSTYSYGNHVIENCGNLTVNAGLLMSETAGGACYCINNNSNGVRAELTVNGGHLYNWYSNAIRIFSNSTEADNVVTINGGIIEGYGPLWLQNPNSNNNKCTLVINGGLFKTTEKAVVEGKIPISEGRTTMELETGYYTSGNDNMSVSITGGTFDCNITIWASKTARGTGSFSVTGGTFNGDFYSNSTQKFITGGTYAVDVQDYVADGYVSVKDDETGMYGIFEADHYVRVTAIRKIGSSVTLTWNGSESGKYLVQMTDSLVSVDGKVQWEPACSVVTGLTVTLPDQTAPVRFYRVSAVAAE